MDVLYGLLTVTVLVSAQLPRARTCELDQVSGNPHSVRQSAIRSVWYGDGIIVLKDAFSRSRGTSTPVNTLASRGVEPACPTSGRPEQCGRRAVLVPPYRDDLRSSPDLGPGPARSVPGLGLNKLPSN